MWAYEKLDNIIKSNNINYIVDTDYIYKIKDYNSINESNYSKEFRKKYIDK